MLDVCWTFAGSRKHFINVCSRGGYLSVNSPAPELTPRVKPKGSVKVRDRIRVRVRVRVSISVSFIENNSSVGELTNKYPGASTPYKPRSKCSKKKGKGSVGIRGVEYYNSAFPYLDTVIMTYHILHAQMFCDA